MPRYRYPSYRRQEINWVSLLGYVAIGAIVLFAYKNGINDRNKLIAQNKDLTKPDYSQEGLTFRLTSPLENKQADQDAFDYINRLRLKYGRNPLAWDERAYALAMARSKDIVERDYFDHVTPEGTCVKDMKAQYGFRDQDNIAENLGGMTYQKNGMPVPETTTREAVNGWMGSRGHRYNMMTIDHQSGAMACYKAVCTFLGINSLPNGFGFGNRCTTGEEGLESWKTAPSPADEVPSPI